MRNVGYLFVMSLGLAVVACGGGSGGKSGGTAKKAGPKQPKKLTSKPSNATAMGMGTSVKPPGGTSGQTLQAPGGTETELYTWQEAIDESGSEATCIGAFAEDGSAAVACSPLVDSCDDGSELDADLLVFYDASQDYGAFVLVGSDLCGSGVDMVGCDFDGSGEVGSCGAGTIDGSTISIDSGE